eukprot:6424081-Alexandrium_andersonii.AAC.1
MCIRDREKEEEEKEEEEESKRRRGRTEEDRGGRRTRKPVAQSAWRAVPGAKFTRGIQILEARTRFRSSKLEARGPSRGPAAPRARKWGCAADSRPA